MSEGTDVALFVCVSVCVVLTINDVAEVLIFFFFLITLTVDDEAE